jgi:hypothetical protein
MKKRHAEHYIILPSCLLLLNVFNQVVGHVAKGRIEPWIETLIVMLLVLAGSSVTAFLIVPWLAALLRFVFRQSAQNAGGAGELTCAVLYFGGVYWLYYILNVHGPGALVPASWTVTAGP